MTAYGSIASYATEAELQAALGGIQPADNRLKMALWVASTWVRQYLGINDPDWSSQDIDWSYDWDVSEVECPAYLKTATIAAAVRILKAPDVPWGAAGGLGDVAVYVKNRLPEVELMLMGRKQSWGVA
jgi:hypothetical protein